MSKATSSPRLPFLVKICGITTPEDARLAVSAGAGAIGLNFVNGSPRYVDPGSAGRISATLPEEVYTVGVFVNASADEITATVEEVNLDMIQLHGDETPQILAELPEDLPVLRAFRYGDPGLLPLVTFVREAEAAGRQLEAVLIDAYVKEAYGGSGETVEWERLAAQLPQLPSPPCILAGGLNPENVTTAIQIVRPSAVDVASGVEEKPGKKDPQLVRQFVAAARAALAGLPQN